MCPALDEPSSSYFRPRAWRETGTTFIQVERDSLSLFGRDVDAFQSNNIIIVVIACRKCSWPWKVPLKCLAAAHRIFLSWMSGASPKQAERLLERPRSSTSKTLVIVQQCSMPHMQVPALEINKCNSQKRAVKGAHLFFCHQRTISNTDSFKHYFIKLLAEEPNQMKRQKKSTHFISP